MNCPTFETYRHEVLLTDTLTDIKAIMNTPAHEEMEKIRDYVVGCMRVGYHERLEFHPSLIKVVSLVCLLLFYFTSLHFTSLHFLHTKLNLSAS